MVQILPTVSYALTDRFSVGFAPSLTLARLSAESLIFAAPDDANRDGFPSYPSGRGNRVQWGGGFQSESTHITEQDWHFGAAIKSPQWFEPFRYKTTDELGRPRTEKFTVEYPLIATVGTAYLDSSGLSSPLTRGSLTTAMRPASREPVGCQWRTNRTRVEQHLCRQRRRAVRGVRALRAAVRVFVQPESD